MVVLFKRKGSQQTAVSTSHSAAARTSLRLVEYTTKMVRVSRGKLDKENRQLHRIAEADDRSPIDTKQRGSVS